MRVIRHESGWDIALDMVFNDKDTADIIAKRIQPAVHSLVRDAVDARMSSPKMTENGARVGESGAFGSRRHTQMSIIAQTA